MKSNLHHGNKRNMIQEHEHVHLESDSSSKGAKMSVGWVLPSGMGRSDLETF